MTGYGLCSGGAKQQLRSEVCASNAPTKGPNRLCVVRHARLWRTLTHAMAKGPRVRRNNRKYHDRVAGRYDRIYDNAYWRFYRDLSWRHLKPWIPEHRPARGADLGCGTGWFGCRMMKAGLDCVFVDPSGKMIARAQDAAATETKRGVQAQFVPAGLEDLSDIPDASLDFATGQGDPLGFCESPKRALDELARVMKPGGALVLSVDSRVGGVRSLLDRKESKSLNQAMDLLRTGRTEWLAERTEERFPMKMFLPEELESLLTKTGFQPRSRIGKTCLVQRRHADDLEDPETRKRWMAAEEKVHGDPAWFALASHFQVVAVRG